MQKSVHQIYSFDEFTLDLTRGCLLRDAEEIKLRPKSFEVLKYLVGNGGRLITKDELIEAVWLETAVTDDSLVQCLKDIRYALNDKKQTYIKTVPRRGYIFEKEVSENGATIYTEETAGVHIVIEDFGQGDAETRRRGDEIIAPRNQSNFLNAVKRNNRIAVFACAFFVIIGAAVSAWQFNSNKNSDALRLFQNVEMKSLTHVGNIVNNAISPDGKYVVYTTADAGRETVWLRQIATDSTHQIAPPANARYFGVSFSRDGNYIFYLRAENSNPLPRVLYRVATLGGVPEKLVTDLDWCPAFSPDGNQMTFVRNSDSRGESVLMIANADGSNERQIAVRPLNESYTFPVWSPDGQTIAASAGSVELGDSFREAVAVSVADGSEKIITTRKWYWISCLAWLSDGSGLMMSGNPEKSHLYNQLWLLSYPNGETRKISNDSNNYTYVSLTADSRALLAGHVELLTHIWIAPEGDSTRARCITSAPGDYKDARWTADGKLTVAAYGGNHTNIWLRDPDGNAAPKQLTANAGTNWEQAVSPDNRSIVFSSDRTGNFHIWRMDIDGGNPAQLTNGSGEKFAKISPDGKWVVYTSFQDWMLWKMPIEGGAFVPISNGYAREQAISPDGKWIAYTTFENDKYRWALMPFEGGSPVKIFDLPPDATKLQTLRWSPDSQNLLFISTREGIGNIWQQPIDGNPPQQLTHFTSDRIFSYDWSPDGKQLAVIRGAWTANMVLLSQK